ncbi:MAG: hypothetical protein U0R50_17485 [Gaiellales bacterium]
MKEQSHKEEMASLLRADFARLRARGVATTLAPGSTALVEPEAEAAPAPAPESPVEVAPAPESAESVASEPASTPAEPVAEGSAKRQGGWLRRLIG